MSTSFDAHVLDIDVEAVAASIMQSIVQSVGRDLKRRGIALGVSGGVDSAVCVALATAALGPERVVALLMPEPDTSEASTGRAERLCAQLGVETVMEPIGDVLEAAGCYSRRDEAIHELFPDFEPGWRHKVSIASDLMHRDRVSYFNLTVESPTGELETRRMPADVYLRVVAATNMKQRTRTMLAYYHAERRNFAVVGTPNRLEYELGFFVRGGDGLADLKPIAHLYKTQVYALAEHLGVTDEIRNTVPTTDTYSLPQTQEEFYFALPLPQLDALLWAWEHDVAAADAAPVVGLEAAQVDRVYQDITAKRRVAARSLRDAYLLEHIDLSERT